MKWAVLLALCLVPLGFNATRLSEPYGTSEDSLNAAIWGLGARNLLARGVDSHRGTLVSPYPGTTGNGIYAHHPPLPVWLMALPVALGGWEGWARLLALVCAAASLVLLFRVLALTFEPRVALIAVAAVSVSGFLLEYGKLFTTLTLATPLFLALLLVTLRGGRAPAWAPLAAVLLVLSSWDGVLGAGALVAVLLLRQRAWVTGLCAAAALAFVAWHLVDATGGTEELRWQLQWRAGSSEFSVSQWLARQGEHLAVGLGPLTLVLLVAAPLAWRREKGALLALLLAAVPGVLMLLIFRQGAHRHAFWGFNLVLPAAVALAMALTIARSFGRAAFGVLLVLFAAQGAWSIWASLARQARDTASNQVGALVSRRFAGEPGPVPMFTHYNFHPYVTWYARSPPDWALTAGELFTRVDEGRWPPNVEVLVDAHFTARLGCRAYPTFDGTADGRWVTAQAGVLRAACMLVPRR